MNSTRVDTYDLSVPGNCQVALLQMGSSVMSTAVVRLFESHHYVHDSTNYHEVQMLSRVSAIYVACIAREQFPRQMLLSKCRSGTVALYACEGYLKLVDVDQISSHCFHFLSCKKVCRFNCS